jgi:hypothetical protein
MLKNAPDGQSGASCLPGVPISLTTSAAIEPDPGRRLRQFAAWFEMPDLVTANLGEQGIQDVCELLLSRGVAIEAGKPRPRTSRISGWCGSSR